MRENNRNDVDPAASTNISDREVFGNSDTAAVGLADRVGQPTDTQTVQRDRRAFGPQPVWFELTVNGRHVHVRADPATTLADVLRDQLELTGTKIACDRGACSACTVWLDGDVVCSCMTLAFDARGRTITTIEGLARDGVLHPVQQAFVDHDAMQCGFCTPGMVMSCAALVEQNANCTLEDVKAAVSGHLCRCGTYPNVFKATLAAAAARSQTGNQGDRQ
jgi:xanthine dehydrogenase YagT iron-sulfur-binding subunit